MLRWWDRQSGECVQSRRAHQGTVQSLKMSPDGRRLSSCGDDGAISIWELESGGHLRTLRRGRPPAQPRIYRGQGMVEEPKKRVRWLMGPSKRPLFSHI